jgi:antitoxin component of RelBE/YafQ-DinJ toxin-antitoxin module
MDMTSITSAYTSLKTIKEIGTVLLNAKIDAEAKQRVSDVLDKLGTVQDTLFYIREELLRVQDENQDLKKQIKELEENLDLKSKMKWKVPFYWLEENDKEDGPFCQKCYDTDGKLIRVQGGSNDKWFCYACKSTFYGPDYKHPQPKMISSGFKVNRW